MALQNEDDAQKHREISSAADEGSFGDAFRALLRRSIRLWLAAVAREDRSGLLTEAFDEPARPQPLIWIWN